MYNTAKVGKCYIVKWITCITLAGNYNPDITLCGDLRFRKYLLPPLNTMSDILQQLQLQTKPKQTTIVGAV